MPPGSDNEKDTLQRVINGFLTGDAEHYRVIRTRIEQYARLKYYGDALNLDDVASDVMELLFRNLKEGRFRGDSLKALEVYIFSMVRNYVINRRKKSGRMHYPGELPEQVDRAQRQDEQVANEDLSCKILSAMDEKCRDLLELKFCKFWSDQEIADHYKKTKNAISTAITRCLKKARDLDFLQYDGNNQ